MVQRSNLLAFVFQLTQIGSHATLMPSVQQDEGEVPAVIGVGVKEDAVLVVELGDAGNKA